MSIGELNAQMRAQRDMSAKAIQFRFDRLQKFIQLCEVTDITKAAGFRRAALLMIASEPVSSNQAIPFLRETIGVARTANDSNMLVAALMALIQQIEASAKPDKPYLAQLNYSLGMTMSAIKHPDTKATLYRAYELCRVDKANLALEARQKLSLVVSRLKQEEGDFEGAELALQLALAESDPA